jgi:hypothetical protein
VQSDKLKRPLFSLSRSCTAIRALPSASSWATAIGSRRCCEGGCRNRPTWLQRHGTNPGRGRKLPIGKGGLRCVPRRTKGCVGGASRVPASAKAGAQRQRHQDAEADGYRQLVAQRRGSKRCRGDSHGGDISHHHVFEGHTVPRLAPKSPISSIRPMKFPSNRGDRCSKEAMCSWIRWMTWTSSSRPK